MTRPRRVAVPFRACTTHLQYEPLLGAESGLQPVGDPMTQKDGIMNNYIVCIHICGRYVSICHVQLCSYFGNWFYISGDLIFWTPNQEAYLVFAWKIWMWCWIGAFERTLNKWVCQQPWRQRLPLSFFEMLDWQFGNWFNGVSPNCLVSFLEKGLVFFNHTKNEVWCPSAWPTHQKTLFLCDPSFVLHVDWAKFLGEFRWYINCPWHSSLRYNSQSNNDFLEATCTANSMSCHPMT